MSRIIRMLGLVLGAIIGDQVAEFIAREMLRGTPYQGLRLGVIAFGIVSGGLVGWLASPPLRAWFVRSMTWVLQRLSGVPLRDVLAGAAGLILGLMVAFLVSIPLMRVPLIGPYVLPLAAILVFGYLGLQLGIQRREDFLTGFPRMSERLAGRGARARRSSAPKLLDTSVIIDGRIADIAETGFLDGVIVTPQFVLRELQLVADSADSLKRNRGRRGLDILQRLQKVATLQIQIVEDDFPAIREVDLKLIELAKVYEGKIITNDFNLNKVAQLQGVEVLNINELANSLKPIVLPGETMRVFILKEGKEYNQGVAYLDDGTMVVVDNARKMIGKTIDVSVTSVLQTTAGKMIFGKWDERAAYSRQTTPVPAAPPVAVPVPVPPQPATVPNAAVETKPGA